MKSYLSNDFNFKEYVNFSDECSIWSAPFGLKLLDFIDYKQNISALDIGFGTGFPLTEIALRLGEGSTVYGIDPWKDAIQRARKKIEYYRVNNIKIIEGFAESIPLTDNSLDLVVSNNGINNVKNIEQVISECSRIIKTGGQFIQTMNLDGSMTEFYSQLEIVLKEMDLVDEIVLMKRHIHEKRPPLDEMISIIKQYGFAVTNIEHDQFCYKFSNGSAMLNHYFIRLAFMEAWIKLLPYNKLDEIFDTIEKRLNEQANYSGGIKLTIPYVLINAHKV